MDTGQQYEPVANQDLGDSLITPPDALPEVNAVPLIEIIAPASLPGGYEFAVTMNHQKYLVTIPSGGVEEGQKFSVRMTDMMLQQATVSIPVGHWRDGLIDLFKYGIWHPHWITSLACSLRKWIPLFALERASHIHSKPVAAGQVINRLNFTWRGTPSQSTAASARAFNIIFLITLFHWFMIVMMWLALQMLDPNDYINDEPDDWEEPTGVLLVIETVFDFFKILYFVITAYILYQVRKSIRAQYAIPGTDMNDACTTIWCPCLVAGQLLRHTTDYDMHPGKLCTTTGLPESNV